MAETLNNNGSTTLSGLKLSNAQRDLIEKNPSIKRMVYRVYRKTRSRESVRTYIDYLQIFFRWLGKSPEEALQQVKDFKNVANDFIDYLSMERKWAPGTVKLARSALKKWLDVDDVVVEWKKVEPPKVWRVERDRLPRKEEIRELLATADLASRTMVLILVSSGLRIGTLVELRMKDVKMEYSCPLITVRPEAAKMRQGYVTFMSHEAKASLQAYIKERELHGEKITGESYVITKERPLGEPITTKAVIDRWHKLLNVGGMAVKNRKWYDLRVHVLRKYFKSWATLSGVPGDLVESFLGHRTGIKQVYFIPGIEDTSNSDVMEKIMAEYEKALPALTIFSEEEKVKVLEGKIEEQKRILEAERGRFEEEKSALAGRLRLLEEAVADLKKLANM